MLVWLQNNIGTIIICAVLLAIVGEIVAVMAKNKKKGKSSCGCGCENCAMNGACHENKEKNK